MVYACASVCARVSVCVCTPVFMCGACDLLQRGLLNSSTNVISNYLSQT